MLNRWIVTVAVIGLSASVAAETIHVDDDNCPGPGSGSAGDPYCSIQAAIDAASDADEIVVSPGTYLEMIDFLGKAVTLRSASGADVTIIDGQGLGSVVTCDNGEGQDTVLDGFTITGGAGTLICAPNCVRFGGGLYNVQANPTVRSCTFSGNTANFGGGIYNLQSSPTITDCTFGGNSVSYPLPSGFGGVGAAILNEEGSNATITGSTFVENSAFWEGGAVANIASDPTLTDCTFTDNTVTDVIGGGAIYNAASSPAVTGCSFDGNFAYDLGGGMYNTEGSAPVITGCMFTGNGAYLRGGGIYNLNSDPVITDCSFSEGTARDGARTSVSRSCSTASRAASAVRRSFAFPCRTAPRTATTTASRM